jgi:CheY-like chemotaxis protein
MTGNNETILTVDDEPEDREILVNILRKEGYTVLEAGTYVEALSIFDQHRGEIDLVVADVVLPGKNGIELAKRLLELKPEIRVLFVSGHAGLDVFREYVELHFLRKPVQPVDLLIRIRRVMLFDEPLLGLPERAVKSGS